jgi:peroxiredoxin
MAMVPHERSLVERLQAKPFVLLGVSVDPSAADTKRAQEEHRMTWRSWCDGTRRIASKYRVHNYPRLFLINPDGIIRRVYEGRPRDADLERDVLHVIQEAETTAKKVAEATRTKVGNDP